MTLTEFLLARIAEDEAVARAVIEADYSDGIWHWDMHRAKPYRSALVDNRGVVVLPPKNDDVYPSKNVADHIARHNPARVLAECEAKRRIVGMFESREEQAHESNAVAAHATGLLLAMKCLATVYADHPDFDEAWRM